MKKRGAVFTIVAVATPVLSIAAIGIFMWVHSTFREELIEAAVKFFELVNPMAPRDVYRWIDSCFLFFWFFSFCASAVLLYSGLMRLVNKNAETVYLTPKLSLWVNCASAAGGTAAAALVLLGYTFLSQGVYLKYPNRIRGLTIAFAIAAIAFLLFAVIYLVQWNTAKSKHGDGSRLSAGVIFFDLFRGFLLTPGYCLLACIAYHILLIFFRDAYY